MAPVEAEDELMAAAEGSDFDNLGDDDSDARDSEGSPAQKHSANPLRTISDADMSGYDTDPRDPMERSNLLFELQRQLQTIQSRLRNRSRRASKAPDGSKTSLRERVRTSQKKIVSTLRERNQRWRNRTEDRLVAFNRRIEKVLSKMRMRKVRQMRHIFCFVCSMINMVIMCFWLGRWPQTFHWWYTCNAVWLIGCRAVWYRWTNCHYFLLDLCYWVNGILLVYIWFFSDNSWLFQGVYGFSGTLMISVPLFRNSFVPHSLDKVTSFMVHMSPVLQLWVIRWPNEDQAQNWAWSLPLAQEMSIWPACTLYFCWAFFYYTFLFGIRDNFIQRKGYDTLYKHMSVDMGLRDKLPKELRGPRTTKVVFMFGHLLLFVAGIFAVHLTYWIHTVLICGATVWGFKNGAQFYMTYFWRVYEEQITAFERQHAEMLNATEGDTVGDKTAMATSPSTTDVPAKSEQVEADDDEDQSCYE